MPEYLFRSNCCRKRLSDTVADMSNRSAAESGAARDEHLSADDADTLASRFQLLSDTGRLRILYLLQHEGPKRVGAIAEEIDASESATSHQLRQLKLAGLVRASRQGREIHYRIADSHIRLLLDAAVEHYLHGHGEDR